MRSKKWQHLVRVGFRVRVRVGLGVGVRGRIRVRVRVRVRGRRGGSTSRRGCRPCAQSSGSSCPPGWRVRVWVRVGVRVRVIVAAAVPARGSELEREEEVLRDRLGGKPADGGERRRAHREVGAAADLVRVRR